MLEEFCSHFRRFVSHIASDVRRGWTTTRVRSRHVARMIARSRRDLNVLLVASALISGSAVWSTAAGATVASSLAKTSATSTRATASPDICDESAPAPASNSIVFAAESSANQIEAIDSDTGNLVGSPIPVGSGPDALAYYQPAGGSSAAPDVVVANGTANTVSIVDALTRTVTATVSLPSGSSPSAVAASSEDPYSVVVDKGTGKVSIISLETDTDVGQVSLTSTANALSSVAFRPDGQYAYITDPSEHKIFVLAYSPGSSPYYTEDTTYTNSSYDFSYIAMNRSNWASEGMLVASSGSSSGAILSFNDGSGTLSAPASIATFSSTVPSAVGFQNGTEYAYVAFQSSTTIKYYLFGSPHTYEGSFSPGSFTAVGAMVFSADTSVLLAADTGHNTVEAMTPTGAEDETTTTGAIVTALAAAFPAQGAYDVYVNVGSTIDAISTAVGSSGVIGASFSDSSGTPNAMAASPDGKYVYLANQTAVKVVTTADVGVTTSPITATISIPTPTGGTTPDLDAIAVSPSGDSVIVADEANGDADVIDTNAADGSAFDTVVATIGVLGSGETSAQTPTAVTFGPDGQFAYVTEWNPGGFSNDGITVLKQASTTSLGYAFDAVDTGLVQDGDTLVQPNGISINPDDEAAYVTGTDSAEYGYEGAVFTFPISWGGTGGNLDGQLASGSTSVSPIWTTEPPYDITYSPEDGTAFVSESLEDISSVDVATGTDEYTTATAGYVGNIAVSPDGLELAATTADFCGGENALQFFDPGNSLTATATVDLSGTPGALTFIPESSPEQPSASELVDGGSNPSELALGDGMVDEDSAGTPSDAPGVSAGVDTGTLSYSLSLNSMSVPGLGIDLDQSATYDSSRASHEGLLGYGWSTSYGITASQNSTTASPNPCGVVVTQEDGSTVTFDPTTPGPYLTCPAISTGYDPPPWAQATLSTAASCHGSDACWVMQRDRGESFYIDETNGELVKEVDLHYNTVTITWGSGSACPGASSTDPCQVTGADDKTFDFSYPSPGTSPCPSSAASCVVVTDPLGRTVTYVLNSSHQLVGVTLANSSTSATYSFTYNGSNQMTSWCDPANQTSCEGSSAYATTIAWSSGLVTSVTAPAMSWTNPWTSESDPLPVPSSTETTYARVNFDPTTGNGTVAIANPDYNVSAATPGASLTLDTYSDFELVSTVSGYGALGEYSSYTIPPQPSESGVPLRDPFNLMPQETMDGLAGTYTTNADVNVDYNTGVTQNTYDADGDLLSTTDPDGNTTTNTYNALGEVLTTTDAMGNTTTNTYDADGDLLTSTTPATNGLSGDPETSNWYNSNGTLCASRTAEETSVSGALTSCVGTGNHATTYTYFSNGSYATAELDTSTSPVGDTTQNYYDADGNVCATRSADGYAVDGALSSCPSGGSAYTTVNLNENLYGTPGEVVSSIDTGGSSFATTYSCFNANGDTTATVSPLGSFSSCSSLSPTTSTYTSFSSYDADGNSVQSIAPLTVADSQGLTSTTAFDGDMNEVLTLSPQGYTVWAGNHSADLTSYETASVPNSDGETVVSAPEPDDTPTCQTDDIASTGASSSMSPCPDSSVSTYDADGDAVQETTPATSLSGGGQEQSTSVFNPDGTTAESTTPSPSGGTTTVDTAGTFNADDEQTNSTNTVGSSTVSATSTAYSGSGASCWTSPSNVSSPSCASPPAGVATVNYYDLDGNLIAQVGPGGADIIEPGGSCSPLAAYENYLSSTPINISDLCAFTTYYVYNEADQLTEEIAPSASSSTSGYVTEGAVTKYSYDDSGNETVTTEPDGATTTDTYNAADEVVGVSYSDQSDNVCEVGTTYYETCMTYDAAGDVTQTVDTSGTTTNSYDDLGRLDSVTDGNGKTVTYGFNGVGELDCISYPQSGTTNTCSTSGAGTTDPPTGDLTYTYDTDGRISSVVDWNGDAFTYGYDCAGDEAWLAETPSTQIPTVTPCAGSSGSVPAAPSPGASGTTFIITADGYSNGSQGGELEYSATSAVTHSTSTPLLSFGSPTVSSDYLSYDGNGDITSEPVYVNGTADNTDTYSYDTQQRLTSGPGVGSTSGSSYEYPNSGGSGFNSEATVDDMGLSVSVTPGGVKTGQEFAGNGELCWSETSPIPGGNSCTSPTGGTPTYEKFTYNSSGELTEETPENGASTTQDLTWNADTGTLSCLNISGSTCSSPTPTAVGTYDYTYNSDGLRMTTEAGTGTGHTSTEFTWDGATSALLSDGTLDYIYGVNSNSPIAEIDPSDSVTSQLISDPSLNVRAVVEVSPSAHNPFAIANYTDYDVWGNPITENGGSVNAGGLTSESGSDPDSMSRFGFEGGYTDPSGLVYLVNRYFDPQAGQFISVDPDNQVTDLPYSFSSDNSIMEYDPLGLCGNWNPGHTEWIHFFNGICTRAGFAAAIAADEATDARDTAAIHAGLLTQITEAFGNIPSAGKRVWKDIWNNPVSRFDQRDICPHLGGICQSPVTMGGIHPDAPLPPGYDPSTWRIGSPSRQSARPYNQYDVYYDPDGGEWRFAPTDNWHNAHWDYRQKPGGEWENVPIDDLPPVKPAPDINFDL